MEEIRMRCETILNFPAEHFEINIPTFFFNKDDS